MAYNQDQAIHISHQLFIEFAHDANQVRGFLNQSGVEISDIRDQIHQPFFLASFLDYLMSWEPVLISICQKANIDPKEIILIRQALDHFQPM